MKRPSTALHFTALGQLSIAGKEKKNREILDSVPLKKYSNEKGTRFMSGRLTGASLFHEYRVILAAMLIYFIQKCSIVAFFIIQFL